MWRCVSFGGGALHLQLVSESSLGRNHIELPTFLIMRKFDKKINKYRVQTGPLKTTDDVGQHGMFCVNIDKRHVAVVVATDGNHDGIDTGWEHLSVHVRNIKTKKSKKPDLPILQEIKKLFFKDEEAVVIYLGNPDEVKDGFEDNIHIFKPKEKFLALPVADINVYTAGLNYIRLASGSTSDKPV